MIHARRETHVRVFTFEYRVEIEIEEAFCISHILCKFSIYYSSFLYEYSSYFTTWSFDSRIEKEID